MRPDRDPSIGFCPDCGWDHANVPGCWRRVRREAQEKLGDPTFTGPLRDRLQAALTALENEQRSLVAFFSATNAAADDTTNEDTE